MSSEPVRDLGTPDLGTPTSACNGKIDIVFVIPNAGNEYFDQAMPSSLSSFVETMNTTLADFDLHVMVLDAGGSWGSPDCPKSKCPADGPCPALDDPSFPCWALHDPTALTKCDDTPGAGVTFPAGTGASNVRCLPDDRRFVSSSAPDFAEDFMCVANLGGDGESSAGAEWLMRAVSPELAYGCNDGFLRDDALLFVFLIAIADYSAYSPPVWANALLEAKGGDQDKIVVVTVAADRSTENPICPGEKVDEPHDIYKFAMLFEHHLLGSYCAPTYAGYFEDSASLVEVLCHEGPPR